MKRGYAQIIALFVAIIVVVAVGLPTVSSLIYTSTHTVSLDDAYTIANGTTTTTLTEFSNGACGRGATLTRAPTNASGVPANYSLANSTGVLTLTAINITEFGTDLTNVSGTCLPSGYLDTGVARTVANLVPVMLAVAGIVVVVITVL